jgi:hypothetical protein
LLESLWLVALTLESIVGGLARTVSHPGSLAIPCHYAYHENAVDLVA